MRRTIQITALLAGLCIAGAAHAAAAKNFICRPEVYDYLVKAQKALEGNDFSTAHDQISRVQKRVRMNEHETALVLQTLGYIYAGQEKFAKSAQTLEECLALDYLPAPTQLSIRYNLGQIYLAAKDYKGASRAFDQWVAHAENPSADSLYTIAAAKFQAEQYREAGQYAEWAVKAKKNPRDSWLQLQLSAYFESKRFRDALPVLQRLIERHPEKRGPWLQLSALYAQLGDDKRALAVMELAHEAGVLNKQDEIVQLAQRLLSQEIPRKAATLLEASMASGRVKKNREVTELLATAWFQARDLAKAAPATEQAAKLAKDGTLYLRLAQIEVEREKFGAAIAAARRALDKGGLRNKGQVHMLIGIANYRLGRVEQARGAFGLAAKDTATSASAQSWKRFLSSETSGGKSSAGDDSE